MRKGDVPPPARTRSAEAFWGPALSDTDYQYFEALNWGERLKKMAANNGGGGGGGGGG